MKQDESRGVNQDPLLQAVPSIAGYKVLGEVVLLARIGEGGMGVVYRGWHLTMNCEVAVKALRPALAVEPEAVARFRREAEAAMRITHDNVVRVHEVHSRRDLHYLVMEFVDGESLADRVERVGRLRTRQVIALGIAIASGLAEAHRQGLVHRDIKPDNLLLHRTGRPKLADLGLVRLAIGEDGRSLVGNTRAIIGTPQFMPPEQWDSPHVKATADVWALGATLFYAVTGRSGVPDLPALRTGQWIQGNEFPSIREVLPKARADFADCLQRCVAREPHRRFADAAELLEELERLGAADDALLRDERYPRIGPAAPPLLPETIALIETRVHGPVLPALRDRAQAPRRANGVAIFVAACFAIAVVVLMWPGASRPAAVPPAPTTNEVEAMLASPGALPTPVLLGAPELHDGTYWVTVQANGAARIAWQLAWTDTAEPVDEHGRVRIQLGSDLLRDALLRVIAVAADATQSAPLVVPLRSLLQTMSISSLSVDGPAAAPRVRVHSLLAVARVQAEADGRVVELSPSGPHEWRATQPNPAPPTTWLIRAWNVAGQQATATCP